MPSLALVRPYRGWMLASVNEVGGRRALSEKAFFSGFGKADTFLIPRVGEGLLRGNQAFFQKIGQRCVEGDHAVLTADLHQTNKVFHLATADAGADGGVVDENLRGEGTGFSVGGGKQTLGDDGKKGVGQLGPHLGEHLGAEHFEDAVDRFLGIGGVEGGDDEVAGFGGLQGDFDGLLVTELGDGDDVGILAQGVAQAGGKAFGVGTDLPLLDETEAGGKDELNGILEDDNNAATVLVDVVEHGAQGSGFP